MTHAFFYEVNYCKTWWRLHQCQLRTVLLLDKLNIFPELSSFWHLSYFKLRKRNHFCFARKVRTSSATVSSVPVELWTPLSQQRCREFRSIAGLFSITMEKNPSSLINCTYLPNGRKISKSMTWVWWQIIPPHSAKILAGLKNYKDR